MIISALVILFLIPIIIVILNRLNINRGYTWFVAAGGSLISWLLIIIIIDPISWSISAALATISVSTILTDITRIQDVEPDSWAAGLVLTGFGILATCASNPMTLLLAWAALDLSEIWIRFFLIKPEYDLHDISLQPILYRVLGLIFLMSAIIRSFSSGLILDFTTVHIMVAGYLFLAAYIRLGVLSIQSKNDEGSLKRHNLGTTMNFVSIAPPLVLLTRVASVGVPQKWEVILILLSLLFAIVGTYRWFIAANKTQDHQYWLLGVSSLIMIGTLQAQPYASLVWGLSLLFSGCLLFLFNHRSKQLMWIPVLGIIGLLPLPFTPAGKGLSLLLQGNIIPAIIVIICLALLIFGYYQHMFKRIQSSDEPEGLARLAYPLGFVLMAVAFIWIIWKISVLDPSNNWSLSKNWWLGIIVCVLSAGLWIVDNKKIIQPDSLIISRLREIQPLTWLSKYSEGILNTVSSFFTFIAQILEGRGGLLWSVIISLFLITIILQI